MPCPTGVPCVDRLRRPTEQKPERTGQVGKGGGKPGTRGVTEGKEWGRRGNFALMMRERVRERKRFTRIA